MELTRRQKIALEMVLEGSGTTALTAIAARLRVSSRTIHRELARLAPLLRDTWGLALTARSGHGLHLVGSAESIDACRRSLSETPRDTLAPEERRRLLAAQLVRSADVSKLFALTKDLESTTTQVRSDLELLRPWFQSHGLDLVLRRGLGVAVEGAEAQRRQALGALVLEQFGEGGVLSLIRGEEPAERDPPGAGSWLLDQVIPPRWFIKAEDVLSSLPRGMRPVLAPLDYLGLVVHLALAGARNESGFRLDAGEQSGEAPLSAGMLSPGMLSAGEAALALLSGMGFGDLPPPLQVAEGTALEQFLRGAKPDQEGGPFASWDGMDCIEAVQTLVDACSRSSGHDFSSDRMLRDGLVAHWGPAWYRVRNRLHIHNPILEQIRSGYPDLFQAVARALAWTFPSTHVPDGEIGYLVLHFGSSLERRGKARVRFRALVVCSAGIGSAHMLASRIRAELPEIDIVANLSWFDVKDSIRTDWDILVSTIPLPLSTEDYILVNPLLDQAGLKAIREFLARRQGSIRSQSPSQPPSTGTLEALKAKGRYLDSIIQILEHFEIFPEASSGWSDDAWRGVLEAALGRIRSHGITDRRLLMDDLAERSRDRGILLPGSRILFLHARSSAIDHTSLSLHLLDQALPDQTGTWQTQPDRLFLMLAPRHLGKELRDILNEISVSLLDPATIKVLNGADMNSIRAHYLGYLDHYVRSLDRQGAPS